MTLNVSKRNSRASLTVTEPQVEEEEEEGSNGSDSSDDDEHESDVRSDDVESEQESEDEDDNKGNVGWADSMSKILRSNKPKNKKTIVLSKAKKHHEVRKTKEKVEFEVIGDDDTKVDSVVKKEDDEEPEIKKKRTDEERYPNVRVKPNILEREKEKLLSKIATRGVVQLFNTVRNQQKDIEKQMEEAGPVERKREKVIKALDKNKFLDKLMGQSKSENVNKVLSAKIKNGDDVKEEKPSTWNVFRDDFMMGAKMKDWDKKGDSEEAAETDESAESD